MSLEPIILMNCILKNQWNIEYWFYGDMLLKKLSYIYFTLCICKLSLKSEFY